MFRARLPALYSDFRSQKHINTDGYQANIAAWIRGLANGTLAGSAHTVDTKPSLLVLHAGQNLIQSVESPKYGPPLALGAVIREAADNGTLVPLEQFMSRTKGISQKPATSWNFLPKALLWWSLQQMGFGRSAVNEEQPPELSFVIIPNLETVSAAFAAKLASSSPSIFERTFSLPHFKKTFNDILPGRKLSDIDVEVLLKYLERDKRLVACNEHVVRLKSSPSDSLIITPEDSAVASLRELMADLEQQVSVLSSRIVELAEGARGAISKQNRVHALSILRFKKLLESQLHTRYVTLGQLQAVAQKLDQAADEVQLITVMKSSAQALKQLNSKIGGIDEVAAVLDDLRENMREADDVTAMIGGLGSAEVGISDSDVAEELEDLARQEQGEEKARAGKQKEGKSRPAQNLEGRFADAVPPSLAPVNSDTKAHKTAQQNEAYSPPLEELNRMSLLEIERG